MAGATECPITLFVINHARVHSEKERKKERKAEREREQVLSRGTPLSVIHRRCSIVTFSAERRSSKEQNEKKLSLSLSLSTRTIQFVAAKETNSVETKEKDAKGRGESLTDFCIIVVLQQQEVRNNSSSGKSEWKRNTSVVMVNDVAPCHGCNWTFPVERRKITTATRGMTW